MQSSRGLAFLVRGTRRRTTRASSLSGHVSSLRRTPAHEMWRGDVASQHPADPSSDVPRSAHRERSRQGGLDKHILGPRRTPRHRTHIARGRRVASSFLPDSCLLLRRQAHRSWSNSAGALKGSSGVRAPRCCDRRPRAVPRGRAHAGSVARRRGGVGGGRGTRLIGARTATPAVSVAGRRARGGGRRPDGVVMWVLLGGSASASDLPRGPGFRAEW